MERIAMPQLGETVTEGTITLWHKQVGDPVAVDEALFEVSTEKVDTEVPSAHAGYLREVLVAEGDTVPIGTVVAVLTETADERYEPLGEEAALSAAPDDAGDPDAPPAPDAAAPPGPDPARPAANRRRFAAEHDAVTSGRGVRNGDTTVTSPSTTPTAGTATATDPSAPRPGGAVLSPVVRRLLAEHQLDPAVVVGSGRDGRITRADVLAAAANRPARDGHGDGGAPAPAPSASAPAAAPAPTATLADLAANLVADPTPLTDDDEVVPFTKARRATAVNMLRSLATSAHTLVATEVDYANVDPVRRAAGLSYLPFVARAVVDAVAEFPHVNASVGDDRLVVHKRVHLGVAVDVDQEALVVPVVHGADHLRLRALSDAIADLADRTRRKRVDTGDLTGGTFTITNVGAYGTLVTAPVINQPQVAILSTDGVRMQPVAVPITDPHAPDAKPSDWGVAVHPVGNLCLSLDHRAFDGAYASAFLARVRELLQTRDWTEEVA